MRNDLSKITFLNFPQMRSSHMKIRRPESKIDVIRLKLFSRNLLIFNAIIIVLLLQRNFLYCIAEEWNLRPIQRLLAGGYDNGYGDSLRVTRRTRRDFPVQGGQSSAQIKSKLLANLNRYSIAKRGDLLAPIAESPSLSQENDYPFMTTKPPNSNLFQPHLTPRPQFTSEDTARKRALVGNKNGELPNLFGNLFLEQSIPLSSSHHRNTSMRQLTRSVTNIQPTIITTSPFTVSVPHGTQNSLDVLYEDIDLAAPEKPPSPYQRNAESVNAGGHNDIFHEFLQVRPTYLNRSSTTAKPSRMKHLKDGALTLRESAKLPATNPQYANDNNANNSKNNNYAIREWRQRMYTSFKEDTLAGNRTSRLDALQSKKRPMPIRKLNNSKIDAEHAKFTLPKYGPISSRRELLTSQSEENNDGHASYLSFLNDVAGRQNQNPPDSHHEKLLSNRKLAKLLVAERNSRNKTFTDNLYTPQKPIEVEPSFQHDAMDEEENIHPIQSPQIPPIAYLRDQREYSKQSQLSGSIGGSQFSSQLLGLPLPQQQPSAIHPSFPYSPNTPPPPLAFSQIPPPLSGKPYEPIQLLSEYATTTFSPLPFLLASASATTTTVAARTSPPEVYVRELENADDEYDQPTIFQPTAVEQPMAPLQQQQQPQRCEGTLLGCVGKQKSLWDSERAAAQLAYEGFQNGRFEENMDMCNSQRLNFIIKESIIAGDAEASKRAIQQRAESELGTFYNVICGTGFFSYIAHTDEFCLTSAGGLNCYVFSPVCSLRLGLASGIARRRYHSHYSRHHRNLAATVSHHRLRRRNNNAQEAYGSVNSEGVGKEKDDESVTVAESDKHYHSTNGSTVVKVDGRSVSSGKRKVEGSIQPKTTTNFYYSARKLPAFLNRN